MVNTIFLRKTNKRAEFLSRTPKYLRSPYPVRKTCYRKEGDGKEQVKKYKNHAFDYLKND